jgi:D-alanyl-D-alanine carboxypeptidase
MIHEEEKMQTLVGQTGPSGAILDRVRQRMRELTRGLLSRKGVRHTIVAVESGDGSFRWIDAVGEADPSGRPMRVDTPVLIASVTKLYIAAATLKLYERGLIALDEPIVAYLPAGSIRGLHRLNGIDHSEKITARQLLSHTSGLADWLEDRPKGESSLIDELDRGEDREIGVDGVIERVRQQLTGHFPPQAPAAERQRVRYSDTNYQLLIGIVEALTGQPLPRAFEELLYRPLGLRHTWHPGDAPLEPTAAPATIWAGDQPFEQPLLLRSFRDLYSTAADGLVFMRALMRGEVFDGPATAAVMRSRWNRFGLPRDAVSLRLPGWPIEYGLGLMRFRMPRIFTPFRPLPAVVGHTGVTGSWSFYCDEWDLYFWGTVDQVTAAPVPFRFVLEQLRALEPAFAPKS